MIALRVVHSCQPPVPSNARASSITPPIDNSNSESWQVISVGENVYAAINTYQSIEDRTEDVVAGMEWLDSISHLLEYFEDGSRTEAFSGIVLRQG